MNAKVAESAENAENAGIASSKEFVMNAGNAGNAKHAGMRTALRKLRRGLMIVASIYLGAAMGLGIVTSAGCGHHVDVGVFVNTLNLERKHREVVVSRDEYDWSRPFEFLQVRRANVIGDGALDRIALMPGRKGLEIQDGSSGRPLQYLTDEYVTDFGSIRVGDEQKDRLVVFTYPNHEGGDTFKVMSMPALLLESEWNEKGGVGAFETVTYHGETALAYLRDDDLVIRDGTGRLLKTVTIPHAGAFRRVWIAELDQDRLALLASGSGYTQYHMVAVFNERSGQLEYQEMRRGLAFGLEATGRGFDVWTDGERVGYELP